MKKVNVKKEIFVVLLIAVIIIAISSKVFATGTSGAPVQIPGLNTDANATVEPTANTTKPTNTAGSAYQNTTLPQTGDASDYAIFAVIAVAAIVAIYAYIKVRNYNI